MNGGATTRHGLVRGLALAGISAAAVMTSLGGTVLSAGAAANPVAAARAEVGYYAAGLPAGKAASGTGVDMACLAPAGNPPADPNAQGAPTNAQWIERDAFNQYCATLRLRDQYTSPSYAYATSTNGDSLWLAQAMGQLSDGPGHLHGGITTLVPGSQAADSFRTISRWEALTGGSATAIAFTSLDGAQLRGHIFMPPSGDTMPAGGYPAVIITDGSVQGYENLYYWAAEGLAQYGYVVMTYDVQGQGDSDLLPSSCTPSPAELQSGSVCTGVPYQQNYNFYQGAEDSLNWFDSPQNPYFSKIDTSEIGIAGHSLGASAVSWVGQCDKRVKTIVAWDDLDAISPEQCGQNVTVPTADQSSAAYSGGKVHTPALALTNDYLFNPEPQTSVPDPHAKDGGYQQLVNEGVNSEIVTFRGATHLTYTYVPYVLPASELAERFAFYYTLAWFDEYLRGGSDPYTGQPALSRLTALGHYDTSSDTNSLGAVSIGAGVFSAQAAAADPTNPEAGNVPYTIDGVSIPNSLSFYYFSAFHLTDPSTGGLEVCSDMRAGCPAATPPTP
ncbi:MAG: alpha/beta hydrolase family protein [Acidimicrobiales bacterium]